MNFSLYDICVPSYLQMLNAAGKVLQKGQDFCNENSLDPNELLDARLHESMLPLRSQIISVAHHSLGAIQGIQRGEFNPPVRVPDATYGDLQQRLKDTVEALEAFSPDAINELAGRPMKFKSGDFEIPFTTENFIQTFSLPNFFFHTTTAYDILRHKGVVLGKADFMGRMRIG